MNIPDDSQLDYETIRCRRELKAFQEQDKELDNYIEVLQSSFNKIASKSSYSEHAFVIYDDLSKLSNNPIYKSKKLIVIKAPPNTTMEIPDSEDVENYFKEIKKKAEEEKDKEAEEILKREKEIADKKYQLNMTSKTSEIKVYTVENEEGENKEQDHNEEEQSNPKQDDNLGNMYGK